MFAQNNDQLNNFFLNNNNDITIANNLVCEKYTVKINNNKTKQTKTTTTTYEYLLMQKNSECCPVTPSIVPWD